MISFENQIYLFFMIAAIIGFSINKRPIRYLVLLSSLAYIGFLQMGCPSPVGALQNITINPFNWTQTRTFWIKLLIVGVPALFLGPIFCGWVCPKGAIQEFLFRKKSEIFVPENVDRWLRKIPYMVLAALIISGLLLHKKLFTSSISPFKVIFNLMGNPFALGFIILILIASIFIYRPFCKYICPIGALLNLISMIGFFKITPNSECNNCELCIKKCDMQALSHSDEDKKPALNKSRCIACGECRQNCPKHSMHCF